MFSFLLNLETHLRLKLICCENTYIHHAKTIPGTYVADSEADSNCTVPTRREFEADWLYISSPQCWFTVFHMYSGWIVSHSRMPPLFYKSPENGLIIKKLSQTNMFPARLETKASCPGFMQLITHESIRVSPSLTSRQTRADWPDRWKVTADVYCQALRNYRYMQWLWIC